MPGEHSLSPTATIPFPRHLISESFLSSDLDPCDAHHPFPARTPSGAGVSSSMMDQKVGTPFPAKRTPWMLAPAPRSVSGLTARPRVPSLTSETTAASILYSPTSPTFTQGGDTATEYGVAHTPLPTIPSRRRYESHIGYADSTLSRDTAQRSVFQLFTSTFGGKGRVKAPSLHSASLPSSPATSDPTTHPFESTPSLTDVSCRSHHSQELANPVRDGGLRPETGHNASGGSTKGAAMPQPTTKSRRKSHTEHVEPEQAVPFNATAEVTPQSLHYAQNLNVFDQDGRKVKFGDLWRRQRTCVIFIRHFWCPLCADYMRSITKHADPELLEMEGVNLVVISNGSPAMIKAYRNIFSFPFQLYTDPSLAVYRALGMSLRTTDGGADSERGHYVRHSTVSGTALAVKNALKYKMPILKPGGDIKQLGGEFVLGPGLQCSYVSRMRNTRSHAPVRDLLMAAGVDLDPTLVPTGVQPQMINDVEELWMQQREADLKKIQARKGMRRGFTCERESCDYEDDSLEATEVDTCPSRAKNANL